MGSLILVLFLLAALAGIEDTDACGKPRREEADSGDIDSDNPNGPRTTTTDIVISLDFDEVEDDDVEEQNDVCISIGDVCRNGDGTCVWYPRGIVCLV